MEAALAVEKVEVRAEVAWRQKAAVVRALAGAGAI